eukprot:COSAG01_NODE_5386_length_4293_cov_16.613019_3_plen_48_part_00
MLAETSYLSAYEVHRWLFIMTVLAVGSVPNLHGAADADFQRAGAGYA